MNLNFLKFSSNQAFSTKTFLLQYNDNDFRLVKIKNCRNKGFEESKKQDFFIPKTEPEEVQRISLSRTKKNIRELALCNGFEYFATITIDSRFCDRFSLENCQTLLKKKLKKIKRDNSDFGYLFITEKHKNGAFHFHGLIKGIDDFYINKNGYLSHKILDEIGFNSFSKIRNYSRCCTYICKYITKSCVKNEHNQIYISSRGLKKAIKTEIDNIDFDAKFENDFCYIADFSLNNKKDKKYVVKCLTL